jgi:hypothetical protein
MSAWLIEQVIKRSILLNGTGNVPNKQNTAATNNIGTTNWLSAANRQTLSHRQNIAAGSFKMLVLNGAVDNKCPAWQNK